MKLYWIEGRNGDLTMRDADKPNGFGGELWGALKLIDGEIAGAGGRWTKTGVYIEIPADLIGRPAEEVKQVLETLVRLEG